MYVCMYVCIYLSIYLSINIFVLFLEFLCSWLNHIKYSNQIQIVSYLNYLPHRGALIGTTIPGQSGPGSNDDEGVLHTPQISRNGASQSDAI